MPVSLAQVEARVLYDEGHVLAVDKPAGLPATGRDLDDTDCMQHLLIQREERMVWAVHQIDAETSGVLVFVKRRSLVERWQRRLSAPTTQKSYLAFVHGVPTWKKAHRIDAPLHYDERARRQAVSEAGRPSTTLVRVRARGEGHALVEARILTGRTHQVRAHLAFVGHPLVGEKRYRAPPCEEHPRHALHAWRLRFHDGDAPAELSAPLPDDLVALAGRLGIALPVELRGH